MMQIKLSDVGFSGPSACVLCAVACFLLHDPKSTVQAWREREALNKALLEQLMFMFTDQEMTKVYEPKVYLRPHI